MSPELQLNILRILAEHPDISQRQLAGRLGISLGSTNHSLKALAERGWVKMQNFCTSPQKARYVYLLTPAGIEQKAKATLRFLRLKEAEHRRLLAEIEQLREEVGGFEVTQRVY